MNMKRTPEQASPTLKRSSRKRQIDFEIIGGWITHRSRVLDLGCGRGILLEYLRRTRGIYGLGVDIDSDKIASCIKRGIHGYQSDIDDALNDFAPDSFDFVVISRTLEMLPHPGETLRNALRVGQSVTVGFINHGFWRNRLRYLTTGERIQNDVYPLSWDESDPGNPVSISGFERWCARANVRIARRHVLSGDWKSPCHILPSIFGGYALYEINTLPPTHRP